MEVRYFGCIDRPGHYLVDHTLRSVHKSPVKMPWREHDIDGKLQPGCKEREERGYGARPPEIEGMAKLHHKDGWTALCFWDRSVDGRGGCNSNFFAEGTHDLNAMLEIARDRFPSIVKRYTFAIVLEADTKTV